jgi:hypothetical protein
VTDKADASAAALRARTVPPHRQPAQHTCRGARRLKAPEWGVLDEADLLDAGRRLRTCLQRLTPTGTATDVSRLPLFAASGTDAAGRRRASSKPPSSSAPSGHLRVLVKEFAFVGDDAIALFFDKAASAPYAVDGLIFLPPPVSRRWGHLMTWRSGYAGAGRA